MLARQVVSPICFEDARDRTWFPCSLRVSLSAGLLGMECEAKLIRLVFFYVCVITISFTASANTGRPKCSSAAAVPTCSARRHTHLLLTGRLNRRRAQFAPFVGTMPSHHYLLCFTVLSSLSPVLLALCCLLGRVSSFWGFLAQKQAPLLHSPS